MRCWSKYHLFRDIVYHTNISIIVILLFAASSTNKNEQAKTKLLYSSIDPTIAIDSGTSTTVFQVEAGRGAEITAGLPVFVRNADFSLISSEATVDTVVGDEVTLKTAIEFIPASGQYLELIGFIDGLGPYRIL